MASFEELVLEYVMLFQNGVEDVDLQLAAELGKTLLERNKELEAAIKQNQISIEDQSQEIEYLTKQNNALREVNDTRLKIYENIEISIQDLEKQNHRLNLENANLKKQHKTISTTNECLEEKCEDLRKHLEELNRQFDIERRKNEKFLQEKLAQKEEPLAAAVHRKSDAHSPNSKQNQANSLSSEIANSTANEFSFESLTNGADFVDGSAFPEHCDSEDLMRIVTDHEATKRQLINERQRVSELEDQLSSLIQENQMLASRFVQSNDMEEMKSMHEELSILEEAGQSKMCRRCLRSVDDDVMIVPDYESSIACTEDGDDISLADLMQSNSSQNVFSPAASNQATPNADTPTVDLSAASPNPYRDLVEKYEALLQVHHKPLNRCRQQSNGPSQDDMTAEDFTSIDTSKEQENAVKEVAVASGGAKRKICLRTPTDFSEAETSSSGFSDETSNKCTQTEGTFLCTIADGDENFSIYDAVDHIDSRFRHNPQHRELFREIFGILKKAAENKDDGEKLPLLDDTHAGCKVPPATPAVEDLPPFPIANDDTESVISSTVSEQSVAMSERVTKRERKNIMEMAKKMEKAGQENKPPIMSVGKQMLENGRVLTPYKREPLEYLAFSNIRKKNKKRGKHIDPSDSPVIPSSPRIIYGSERGSSRRRRDRSNTSRTSNTAQSPSTSTANVDVAWNGSSLTVYNRNMQSPVPVTKKTKSRDHHEKRSAASHDLHKLMKLDLSYAEVLRRADRSQNHRRK